MNKWWWVGVAGIVTGLVVVAVWQAGGANVKPVGVSPTPLPAAKTWDATETRYMLVKQIKLAP